MPPKFYYALNKRNAQQNYNEQRENMKERLTEPQSLKDTLEAAVFDLIKEISII